MVGRSPDRGRGNESGPPGRVLPMNGDEVRDAGFLIRPGYAVSAVDALLGRVAVALDAGRPAGSLIKNAAFPHRAEGYDIDAVDFPVKFFCSTDPAVATLLGRPCVTPALSTSLARPPGVEPR
jgi:hypothetical protein